MSKAITQETVQDTALGTIND